jgi:hypothetical protein
VISFKLTDTVKVKKEKSVSDTKKKQISKANDKALVKEKEANIRKRGSVLKPEEHYISDTSIEIEVEKDMEQEIKKKGDLPCIIEESLDSSRKESNELAISNKESSQLTSVSNPFKSSVEQESSIKELSINHVPNFTKKQEGERDILEHKSRNILEKKLEKSLGTGSKENSFREKTGKSGVISEEEHVRERANAKNTSFEHEKSVLEETVREFENFEFENNQKVVDVIKNSKEDHKDILIKMKFENQNVEEESELLNQMAMEAIARITKKFQGKDFENSGSLNAYGYKAQVERLIKEASDPFNLCQSYSGWNPFL